MSNTRPCVLRRLCYHAATRLWDGRCVPEVFIRKTGPGRAGQGATAKLEPLATGVGEGDRTPLWYSYPTQRRRPALDKVGVEAREGGSTAHRGNTRRLSQTACLNEHSHTYFESVSPHARKGVAGRAEESSPRASTVYPVGTTYHAKNIAHCSRERLCGTFGTLLRGASVHERPRSAPGSICAE